MNLNSTLTARDKKLLYMLVFIVIIFIFGWYLIRPLYKKTVADQESISIAATTGLLMLFFSDLISR